MLLNAKKMAFTGLLGAFAVVLLVLGSVIEMSSLFFIAGAAFCVGIVIREWGIKISAVFLTASFLIGLFVVPNRMYCFTFLAMGLYLVLSESVWEWVAKSTKLLKKKRAVWIGRYVIFNCLFLLVWWLFPTMIVEKQVTGRLFLFAFVGGQIGLYLFEIAYQYFQTSIWGKLRHKVLR